MSITQRIFTIYNSHVIYHISYETEAYFRNSIPRVKSTALLACQVAVLTVKHAAFPSNSVIKIVSCSSPTQGEENNGHLWAGMKLSQHNMSSLIHYVYQLWICDFINVLKFDMYNTSEEKFIKKKNTDLKAGRKKRPGKPWYRWKDNIKNIRKQGSGCIRLSWRRR